MTGAKYVQETGTLRTGGFYNALQCKDCSEFVNRVMAADGITDGVSDQATSGMKTFFSNTKQFIHSWEPETGDIALWEGHVGIVSAANDEGEIKLIAARGVGKLSAENKHYLPPSDYRDSEFYGYYRPVIETPDGKKIDVNAGTKASQSKPQKEKKEKKDKENPKNKPYKPNFSVPSQEWLEFQLMLLNSGLAERGKQKNSNEN